MEYWNDGPRARKRIYLFLPFFDTHYSTLPILHNSMGKG
jgi:hypothetical protein